MELSWILFQKILSMVLMLAIGYVLVKTKKMSTEQSAALSAIMLWVVTPCIMLTSLQQTFEMEKLKALLYLFGAVILIHILFIALASFLKKALKLDTVEQICLVYSNGGNLIVPLVTALLGKEFILFGIPFLVVQTTLFWTHVIRLYDPNTPVNLKKILLNPNILAIAAGLILFFLNIRLPKPALDLCDAMTGMAGPLSMLMIGMLSAGLDWKKTLTDRRVWLVCFGRLMAFPLLFLLLLAASRISAQSVLLHQAFLVTSLAICAPVAATVVQMADSFGSLKQAELASAVNVLSTILCVVTMPLLIGVYQLLC